MANDGVAEVVEDGTEERAFSPLDNLVKELDGPDLEGDLEEGDVTSKPEDKPADEGEESQKADEADPASEDETGDDAGDDGDDSGEGGDDEPKDEVDPRDAEIARLRTITRNQEKDLRELRKQSAAIDKKLTESGLVSDDEAEAGSEQSTVVDEAIRVKLETIAETMKLNPNYADLDDVVTEDRYSDTIEGAVSKLIEDGYDKDEAFDLANEYVWTRPNPYKYLYDLIKGGHPDFKKEVAGDEAETKDEKAETKTETKADKKKASVAPSISKTPGGGGSEKGGWTAARIDDLPEGRLNEVPTAIYDKYLAGELD